MPEPRNKGIGPYPDDDPIAQLVGDLSAVVAAARAYVYEYGSGASKTSIALWRAVHELDQRVTNA